MGEELSFQELLRRVRAGDEAAATTLVRQYEPAIRRIVRMHLTDPRLSRLFDSVDICQSVLASFFVRIAVGSFELETPQQLLQLLATMARNKLLDQVRRQKVRRRDFRRVQGGGDEAFDGVAAAQATPSQILVSKDLLEQVLGQLSEEERHLANQRAQGREWAEIAREVGGSPEALRKKLARAVERAARRLGLEELYRE